MNTPYMAAELNASQVDAIHVLEEGLSIVAVALRPAATFASLTSKQLERIREVESDLEAVVIAFDEGGPVTALGPLAGSARVARLNKDQLKQVHDLEKKLEVVLIATENSKQISP